MSQVNVLYQSDSGGVYQMRLSKEKLLTLPPATGLPASATDPAVEVKISKTRREFGMRPRGVIYSRLVSNADGTETFRKSVFFPCQTTAQQNAVVGQPTVTYKGKTYENPKAVKES